MKYLVFLFLCAGALPLQAQRQSDTAIPDHYIIQLQAGVSIAQWQNAEGRQIAGIEQARIEPISARLGVYQLILPGSGQRHLPALKKMSQIRHAGMDEALQRRGFEPNDPFYPEQWHLDKIQAPTVWEVTQGELDARGKEMVIAIVDEGYEVNHPDLNAHLYRNTAEIPDDGLDNDNNGYVDDYLGYNSAIKNDNHPVDYHGTAVAGLAAGIGNNNAGITGVAWNAKLLLLSGSATVSQALACYDYILNMRILYNETNGAKGINVWVTNSSFGKDYALAKDYPQWCEFYNAMGEAGILSVASTTNTDINVDEQGDMPTTCTSPYLLTVTNTTINDIKAQDAGVGPVSIDIGSPGTNVYTLGLSGSYSGFDGTSAAAPVAAGGAALLFCIPSESFGTLMKEHPAQAVLAVKEAILRGVDRIGDLQGRTVSNGRLNLARAMEALQDTFGVGSGELEIVQISPNPVQDLISVQWKTRNYDTHEFLVINPAGQVLIQQEVTPSRWENTTPGIDTRPLAAGTYYFVIRRGKESVAKPFVKYK